MIPVNGKHLGYRIGTSDRTTGDLANIPDGFIVYNSTNGNTFIKDGSGNWASGGSLSGTPSANLLTASNTFNDPVWTTVSGVTFTDEFAEAPDSSMTATLYTKTVQNSGSFEQETHLSVNTEYTASLYLLFNATSAVGQFKFYDGSTDTFSSYIDWTAVSPTWTQVSWTFTTPGTLGGYTSIAFASAADINTAPTVQIWGFQLEPGSSASPYVIGGGGGSTETTTAVTDLLVDWVLS